MDQERIQCLKEHLTASESQVQCLKESVQKSNVTLKSRCDRYTSFRESNEAKLHGLKKCLKSQITEHAKELSIAVVHHAKELEKEKNLRKKNERRFSRDTSKVDNQKVEQDRLNSQMSLSVKENYEMQLRQQHRLHMKNMQMKASAHPSIIMDNAKQHKVVLT